MAKHFTITLAQFLPLFLPFLGSHCLEPYPPPNGTGLIVSGWDGNLIEFEDKVIYICDRGRKFQDDFDQINVEATCKPEYTWDLPVWGQCIESNYQLFTYRKVASRSTSLLVARLDK